jgi:hypothetical protein
MPSFRDIVLLSTRKVDSRRMLKGSFCHASTALHSTALSDINLQNYSESQGVSSIELFVIATVCRLFDPRNGLEFVLVNRPLYGFSRSYLLLCSRLLHSVQRSIQDTSFQVQDIRLIPLTLGVLSHGYKQRICHVLLYAHSLSVLSFPYGRDTFISGRAEISTLVHGSGKISF